MDYKVYNFDYIKDNQTEIIMQCDMLKKLHNFDMTKKYYEYNIFSLSAGSIQFYEVYKFLSHIIRENIGNQKAWIQSWLNYHTESEVLDWHDHHWEYHGYISIDPKDTTTEFENYSIENRVGKIYYGPGYRKHRVKVNTPYSGHRITIGFDVLLEPVMNTGCLGFIPLL